MNKLYKVEGYKYTFEDRIYKDKLPKGLSYVVQTTDITNVLSKDGLSVHYAYNPDNPGKLKNKLWGSKDFSFTKVNLLSYSKYVGRRGEPDTMMDYDRYLVVYSVPAKIRKALRQTIVSNVLPFLKAVESKPKFNIAVYYSCFSKSNYDPLDHGGLYIEQDRYSDKAVVLYRDKKFDIDEQVKELVT